MGEYCKPTPDYPIFPIIWSVAIDERAKDKPDSIFCEILESDWREKGSRKITYFETARAINRMCRWMDAEFGPSQNLDSFAYYGDNDLRYTLAMVAAQKSGRQMVIAELERLTHPALLLLLEDTKCFRWLGGSPAQKALGQPLLTERPATQLSTLPPLEHWLEDGEVDEYPFDKSWDDIKSEPCFVIHSSGTTGTPKTLRYSLEISGTANFVERLPDGTFNKPNSMIEPLLNSRGFWVAPPKWLGGVLGQLYYPIYYNFCPIWPPVHEGTPTHAPVVAEMIAKIKPEGAFYVPSTLRDLCLDKSALELVKKHHKWIVYGGAPLEEWVGNLLCTELSLVTIVGATETCLWTLQRPDDPRDWQYYRLDKRVGWHLEYFKDDMYELVFHKNPAWQRFQGAFVMFPELDVYHTQDLYSPHPTRPDEYIRYRGRKDDLVKLVWLTKVRAGDMEAALCQNPLIANAMVGGEGRPTPFVILEVSKDAQQHKTADELWPIVEELNKSLSAEVHVPRQNVIVAHPDKPLKRLGKGTLDRRGILLDYQRDIGQIYGDDAST